MISGYEIVIDLKYYRVYKKRNVIIQIKCK